MLRSPPSTATPAAVQRDDATDTWPLLSTLSTTSFTMTIGSCHNLAPDASFDGDGTRARGGEGQGVGWSRRQATLGYTTTEKIYRGGQI
jgi:hypothetical protein